MLQEGRPNVYRALFRLQALVLGGGLFPLFPFNLRSTHRIHFINAKHANTWSIDFISICAFSAV
jgi:hypothetical protein